MKISALTLSLIALLSLTACSKPNEAETPKVEAPKTEEPKAEAEKIKLFEAQRNVLESAKAVDKTQQQQTEEQKKAIEQQTQ
jgi:cell division protein FtsN